MAVPTSKVGGCFSLGCTARTLYAGFMFCSLQVLLKCVGVAMPNYSFQFCLALSVGGATMFGAIWLCWDLTQRYRSGEPLLTELDKTAAWRQAVVISFWFAVNYILLTGSNPYVDGPIEVLCTQMPVMLGLVFNRVLLRKSYSWFSWLGGLLVLVASCVSIFRMLADKDAAGSTNLGWAVVYLIGNAPLGIMAPLWEMTYFPGVRGRDRQPITPAWQLFLINAMLTVWLMVGSPLLGKMTGTDPWGTMTDATECVFRGVDQAGNDCPHAAVVLVLMILVTSLQMHSIALLSGYESGSWANLITGVSPFGADLVFPFLPGAYKQTVSPWDGAGVALAVCGLFVYLYGENLMEKDPVRQAWRPWKDPWGFVRWIIPDTAAYSGLELDDDIDPRDKPFVHGIGLSTLVDPYHTVHPLHAHDHSHDGGVSLNNSASTTRLLAAEWQGHA